MRTKPVPSVRNRYILAADLLLIIISVLGSYALRLELTDSFFIYLPSAYWMIGAALIIKPAAYYFFGLYRRMWIYATTRELISHRHGGSHLIRASFSGDDLAGSPARVHRLPSLRPGH